MSTPVLFRFVSDEWTQPTHVSETTLCNNTLHKNDLVSVYNVKSDGSVQIDKAIVQFPTENYVMVRFLSSEGNFYGKSFKAVPLWLVSKETSKKTMDT